MAEKVGSDPNSDFELSKHLPYLFKHIHSQLEVASAGALAGFGINVAVWRILVVLWQHDDLSHRDLAELTSIEVSTLSRISKAVQRDGLIRRKRPQQDQRTVRVTLTEKGRELVKRAIPSAGGIQADIIGDLSPADVENLTRILHVIVENLNRFSASDDLEAEEVVKPAAARKRAVAREPKAVAVPRRPRRKSVPSLR